jgi:hypothetical protein
MRLASDTRPQTPDPKTIQRFCAVTVNTSIITITRVKKPTFDSAFCTSNHEEMNNTLRNALALIVGIILAFALNSALINLLSGFIGIESDPSMTLEQAKAMVSNMEPRQFSVPFLAHAFGTFGGAYVAARLSKTQSMVLAITVGVFHLAGGVANVVVIPHPILFVVLDLVIAYIPVAWIAGKLGDR